MSEQQGGYSPAGAPPSTPGLPQNPLPIVFSGFSTLNTKASQQGIQDQEMFVCDGFMPLGPNNLRALRGIGAPIYTAPPGLTIENYSFNNLGSDPLCIVALSDGSLVQVDVETLDTTQIAVAGTITSLPPDINQWGGTYIIIVAPQSNGYFLWDGTNLFTTGTLSPEVTIINSGTGYTSPPTVSTQSGTPATGSISWTVDPSPGETATFNGVAWTFVTGAPVGNQIQITGIRGFTINNLVVALNASSDPRLTVATYTGTGISTSDANVTYKSGGVIGNSYTLAASAATPSGMTLTGGTGTGGRGAEFSATVENGSVVSITVTNPGIGYVVTDTPILTIIGGGSDDMASASLSFSAASGIGSVVVLNGGSGYSGLTGVDISGGGGTGASLSVVGSNGTITGVTVLNPGSGFTSVPTLTAVDPATSPGSGATLTAVLAGGQIGSVNVDTSGSGYTSPPALTVIGDGTGAQLLAEISGGVVTDITIVAAGTGYTTGVVQFDGGNRGAAAVATLMPFGVSGTTSETYQSRVWVGNGRTGQISAPGSPSDFSAGDGSTAFSSIDSFLRERYTKFIQSNGFIYFFADSSINYGSGVNTSGNPAVTTFNNQNVDPQVGTPWPATVQPFGRDLIFANSVGVFVSYGGAVTKVSDQLDGIYATVPESDWPAGFIPSGAVMTIFGIRCYILALPILDQVTGRQVVKCLMWDGKRWWTSPQEGFTNPFLASQDFNSVLTAYCSSNSTTINPMFANLAENFERYLYSKLWDNPGVFTTKMMRQIYGILNINFIDPAPTTASGFINFASNQSPGDTITMNSVVFTFVSGAPGANQIQIGGTVGLTVLNAFNTLNASVNPLITVATYSGSGSPPNEHLNVTFDTTGAIGNSYTLAASNGTPSSVTLTGGSDGPAFFVAPITENGVGNEIEVVVGKTGPFVFGPLAAVEPGSLMGMRFRTAMSDIQINSLTLFSQIEQSKV